MQHDFSFRNKAALLTEIQRATRRGGGLSVRTLKESWKEAPAAIEELEKDNEVYVTRTLKDGQMRMVFWNEVKPDKADLEAVDEGGQKGFLVEKGVWFPYSCARLARLTTGYLLCRVQRPVAQTKGPKRRGSLEGARQRYAVFLHHVSFPRAFVVDLNFACL